METTETIEKEKKHWEVDSSLIKPLNRAGGNIRNDYGKEDGSFKELVASIENNGVLVPLRAFRDLENEGFWIAIDGHRRLAACEVLTERGLTVRVRIIPVDARKVSDEQMIVDMVVTNSGKPLSPIELSEAVRRLIALGLNAKEVSAKFGMSNHAVRNLELLGSAPKRVRDLIAQNKLKYTVALDFLKSSTDFNDAVSKIEQALEMASTEKKKAVKRDTTDEESEEEFEVSEEVHAKVTRKHLNEVNNKVDSVMELKKVFKELIDKPDFDIKNAELYSFAKRLVENKLTAPDIKKLLF